MSLQRVQYTSRQMELRLHKESGGPAWQTGFQAVWAQSSDMLLSTTSSRSEERRALLQLQLAGKWNLVAGISSSVASDAYIARNSPR